MPAGRSVQLKSVTELSTPNPGLVIFQVINNNISLIEIKKLIKNYLACIANDYPKIQELIFAGLLLPDVTRGFLLSVTRIK